MKAVFMTALVDGIPIGGKSVDISSLVERLTDEERASILSDLNADSLANASYLPIMRVLPLNSEAFSAVTRASDICEAGDRRFDIRLSASPH